MWVIPHVFGLDVIFCVFKHQFKFLITKIEEITCTRSKYNVVSWISRKYFKNNNHTTRELFCNGFSTSHNWIMKPTISNKKRSEIVQQFYLQWRYKLISWRRTLFWWSTFQITNFSWILAKLKYHRTNFPLHVAFQLLDIFWFIGINQWLNIILQKT